MAEQAIAQDSGWHTPQVHKDRVWRGYVDSYDDHAFGILQENAQNSFDAYPPGTPGREMKIIVKYDADNRILTHRDFKTLGMGHCRECSWGLKSESIECTAIDCPWGCFHNMGFSGKAGTDLGSRGMGKCLQLLAGKKTLVRTRLPDGSHQASEWQMIAGDWHWRYSPENDEALSSPGVELRTLEIIDRVHNTLIQMDKVVEELQARWFRLLAQGAVIEYILILNGKQHRALVGPLKFPPLDDSRGKEKAHLIKDTVVVKFQGKRLGELRNFNICLSKTPFSEDDPIWGIAIVKNGKQTIARFKDFPEEIPENLRKRIFGFTDAICTSEEPFLREAETATHTGYQYSHPVYKATRAQIRSIVKVFVEPFISSGGERVTEKEHEEAQEILDVLNKALQEVPGFGLFGREEDTARKKIETAPKDYIYLSRLDFDNRSYRRGENAIVEAVIKNPTDKETLIMASFEHFDPTPVVVGTFEDGAIVPAGTQDAPGTASIVAQISFDDNQAPGIHWIQVTLQDRSKKPLVDDEGNLIRMRRHIYCEFEPKKISRTRSGTGETEEGKGKGGGEGSFGFAAIQWFKKAVLADTVEAYLDMSQAVAFVNRKGKRLEFYRSMSKTKQGSWPAVIEIIAEKILEKKAEMDAGEKEQWQAEELKNEIIQLEQMKAKLIRAVVGLLA